VHCYAFQMCLRSAAPAETKTWGSRAEAVLSSALARSIMMSVSVLTVIVDCAFAASGSAKVKKCGLNFKSIHWRENPLSRESSSSKESVRFDCRLLQSLWTAFWHGLTGDQCEMQARHHGLHGE
jgi:hypothetical protein